MVLLLLLLLRLPGVLEGRKQWRALLGLLLRRVRWLALLVLGVCRARTILERKLRHGF